MKKFLKELACVILIIVLVIPMASCKGPEEEEAIALVKDLLSKSLELNEIYYGKGLDYEKNEDGVYGNIYSRVSKDAKYRIREDLERATRKVFSASYSKSIIDHAFNMTLGIYGGGSNPRYFVGSDGYLTVLREYGAREITEYNFDSIKIKRSRSKKIVATVMSTENEEIEIILVKEKDGWRLDSATV